jgi:ABC-type transport system involved in multi-copper enzyme maturation permease subunit
MPEREAKSMLKSSLLLKELREHRWTLLIGTGIMTAMGIFSAWSFQWFALYENMLTEYLQPELVEQFEPLLEDYTFYLWSQWHPKNLLQIGTIIAIILAAPAIAGEVNRGTIKYLTSLPLSRERILFNKAVTGILDLSALIWISTLIMLAVGSLLESGVDWGTMLLATCLSNLGLVGVYAFALSFSALGSDSIKAGAGAAGLLLLWSGAGLHPRTAVLSPFWHMKGIAWFTGQGPFPWPSLVILLFFALASFYLAGRIFTKRQY